MTTLYDLAKDNLSIEELESIINEKRQASDPVELSIIEQYQMMHYDFLTKGPKPKLYPPKHKSQLL